jgi:hypothetical protein
MVRPVDYRQVDVRFRQNSADVHAAKTAANHHDFGARVSSGCRPIAAPPFSVGRRAGGCVAAKGPGLLQSIFERTEVCL